MENLKVITFRIDPEIDEKLEKLTRSLRYSKKSQLIRAAIKLMTDYMSEGQIYRLVWDLNKKKPDNNWSVTHEPKIKPPKGHQEQ